MKPFWVILGEKKVEVPEAAAAFSGEILEILVTKTESLKSLKLFTRERDSLPEDTVLTFQDLLGCGHWRE